MAFRGENLAFVGSDLNPWQSAFTPVAAPFAIDFGTAPGKEAAVKLVLTEDPAWTGGEGWSLEEDALRAGRWSSASR
jgi:hypothetical protein